MGLQLYLQLFKNLIWFNARLKMVKILVENGYCLSKAIYIYIYIYIYGRDLFHLPTLMHNSLFINNMYVTL